jgi:anti-anti-sigma factor
VAVVHVAGELDASTAPDLRAALDSPSEQAPTTLVIDLSAVTFLGAAGLSVLIAAQRRADDTQHTLALITGPHCVERILHVTGLRRHFSCYRSLPDVLCTGAPQPDEPTHSGNDIAPVTAIACRDGHPVEVLESYRPWHGLQLHSLAGQAHYVCTVCGRARDTTMAATHEIPAGVDALVCPGCYARITGPTTPGSAQW